MKVVPPDSSAAQKGARAEAGERARGHGPSSGEGRTAHAQLLRED